MLMSLISPNKLAWTHCPHTISRPLWYKKDCIQAQKYTRRHITCLHVYWSTYLQPKGDSCSNRHTQFQKNLLNGDVTSTCTPRSDLNWIAPRKSLQTNWRRWGIASSVALERLA